MITSCPHCNARFRVTHEQLASRQGLVCCGRCSTIFNGFATLHGEPAEDMPAAGQTTAAEAGTPSTKVESLSGHIEGALPPPSWAPAVDTVKTEPERPAGTVPSIDAESPSTAFSLPDGRLDSVPPPPVWTPADNEAAEAKAGEGLAAAQPVAVRPPAKPEPAATAPETPAAEPLSVDALKAFAAALEKAEAEAEATEAESAVEAAHAIPDEAVPSPAVASPVQTTLYPPEFHARASPQQKRMLAGVAILLLLLAAQTTFLLRSEIAVNWPDAKPYLTGICDWLGCQVALPRKIDSLTIEASELLADPTRPNVVLLTAIVRNRGPTMQAYPSLEVTLTDTLDRPVARRSLDATEYLPQASKYDEGIGATGEVIAKTAIETVDIKPSGYRLRLYYR